MFSSRAARNGKKRKGHKGELVGCVCAYRTRGYRFRVFYTFVEQIYDVDISASYRCCSASCYRCCAQALIILT